MRNSIKPLAFAVVSTLSSSMVWAMTSGEAESMLSMSMEELLSLEIETAGKTGEKISAVPASVVVIPRAEIERYGYRSLEEILQNVTGLYGMGAYSCCGMTFGLRGFSDTNNRQLIVLVDGVKISDILYSGYLFNMINVPVEAIDRIEVVRGPLSVIYGDGAFFGVVNVITRLSDQEQRGGSRVAYSMGNRGAAKWFARLDGGSEDSWTYTLNASTATDNGIDVPYRDLSSDLSEFGVEHDTTAGKLDKDDKYVSLFAGKGGFSMRLSHSEANTEGFFFMPSILEDGVEYNVETTSLQAAYETDLSEAWQLKSSIAHLLQTFYSDFSRQGIHGDSNALEDSEYNTTEAELNLVYTPDERFQVVSGLAYTYTPKIWSHTDIPAVGLDRIFIEMEDARQTYALFSQASYQLNPQWRLVLGARWQRVDEYVLREYSDSAVAPFELERDFGGDDQIMPRVAAIWQPSAKHTFKLLYGEALLWPSPGQNLAILENPDADPLEVERVKTLELVHLFQPAPSFDTSVSLFHSDLNNLIVRDAKLIDGQFVDVRNNSGEMTSTGLEAVVDWRPTAKWDMQLSASYQQTEDRKFDRDASYSPDWLGYFKTAYRIEPGTTLAFNANYIDAMQAAIPLGETAPIGQDTDAVFLLGMNLRVDDWLRKDLFFNLRVSNLLDEEIRYPTTDANLWIDKGIIGEGRRIWMSVGMEF